MSWEKIENHLFDKYCVEGEDKELCNLQIEHDKEIRNKVIDEFVELFIEKDSKHIMDYNYYETLREVAMQMKEGAE